MSEIVYYPGGARVGQLRPDTLSLSSVKADSILPCKTPEKLNVRVEIIAVGDELVSGRKGNSSPYPPGHSTP